MLTAGDSRMEWTLRLVGMGIDGQSRSFEVMTINRPDGLGDIADLGLTLAESKLLLAHVQRQLVAEQASTYAAFRPDCGSCGKTCHVKDWQPHRIATLFGEVRPAWLVNYAKRYRAGLRSGLRSPRARRTSWLTGE